MIKRFLVILSISIFGFVATRIWYVRTAKDFGEPERESIAYLKADQNVVEQKLVDRLVWKDIRKGQPLYHGDTVRTASKSEGEVAFLKSGVEIFLHENTIIIIEELFGESSLNLLSGSLFAHSVTGAGAPKIRAGEAHFSLKEGSALNVAAHDDKIHAAVAKGNVSIKTKTEDIHLEEGATGKLSKEGFDQRAFIKILHPRPNALLEKGSPIAFAWEGIKEGVEVALRMGSSLKTLNRVASVKDTMPSGTMTFPAPEGSFYWQLVALEQGKEIRESMLFRGEGVALSAPELFYPSDNAVFDSFETKPRLHLSWKVPHRTQKVKLEIAEDAAFKTPFLTQEWDHRSEFNVLFDQNKPYFWRVTAVWEAPFIPKTSSVSRFSFRHLKNLPTPQALLPDNDRIFVFQRLDPKGLAFEWTPVREADRYRFKVKFDGEKEQVIETNKTVFRFKDPNAKGGTWSVQAFDEFNVSTWSEQRRFSVIHAADVEWLKPKQKQVEYFTPKPQLDLAWTPTQGVALWVLHYKSEEGDISQSGKRTLSQAETPLVLEEGLWRFAVEGFDEQGTMIALSKPLLVKLEPSALIPPPQLDEQTRVLQAKRDGTYFLRWNSVTRAAGYEIEMVHTDLGKRKVSTQKTSHQLESLMPGRYSLNLRSKNVNGVLGPVSEEYAIDVPDVSDIQAPEIERIVIK
ncbi:MAG: hypothetical protein HYW48_08535 [Deltaproteobacteria bacterium]|nr:hypothetical protein [Deltaproteobacteria bacterium]